MSAYRMVVRATGGPERIEREEYEPGSPGANEVRIATEAVGLNFIDIYHRTGLYPAPLPLTLGLESVGRIEAMGEGVTGFAVGERVGCVVGLGAYATHRILPAAQAVRVPDGISADVAAAVLLKGLTAGFLAEDTPRPPPGPGDTVLVHSAAGGVGSILVPWLTDNGAAVIAHSGTAAKAGEVAATHSLSCPLDELAGRVRDLTDGRGVQVVYDGVGAASWAASLASVQRRGLVVSYGNASGPVPPVPLLALAQAGSVYVTRPTLIDYIADRTGLDSLSSRLFDRVASGVVAPRIGRHLPLADAAEAHRALEARETVGSTVLVV